MANETSGGNAKISVIIPAYKAENSIVPCVQSVLDQDFDNIEILVVNDCSPDRTRKVIEDSFANDLRVRLINPDQNVGVHAARRIGVAASTGNYIGFVDADDYVQPDMYSTLLKRMMDDNSLIAICSAALVSEGQRLSVQRIKIRRSDTVRKDVLAAFCRLKLGSGVLWNKLYKREVIEGPALMELERSVDGSEDYIVNFGAFARADTVSLCTEPLYNYVAHSASLSAEKGWTAFCRLFRAYVVCLEKYASDDPNLSRMIDRLYLKQLHFSVYLIADGDMPSSADKEHLAGSLHRIADINPSSVYNILHSLPPLYSRIERLRNIVRAN